MKLVTNPSNDDNEEAYQQAERRPATVVYDFRGEENYSRYSCIDVHLVEESSVTALQGLEDAFVISEVLSADECDELIRLAETDGIVAPQKEAGTLRTAKRTDRYQNGELSARIDSRIGEALLERFGPDSSLGPFDHLHSNWRILRYDPGDCFPAHQDQMDSIQRKDEATGKKDLLVSSHTLLLNLSSPTSMGGGATRFYPKARLSASASIAEEYEYAVDVVLPRGWALVFPQLGMVHAGQPVLAGSKYVAQAGVLRVLPPQKVLKPSVFKLGPGLARP